MRIPSGKTDQYVYFVAVDLTDLKTRKTGLSGFSVYRSRNGVAEVAYTTPTITEIDASNMPGVYALLVDEDTTIASTSDSEQYCLHIAHASMASVTVVIELYRRDTTSGQTITVANGCADADIERLQGSAIATPTVAGVLEVDVTHWIGTAAATPTTAGVPEVDVTFWLGTAAQGASGRPQVDVELWLGSAPNALASGRVDATVGAMQADVLTNSAIAADAIGSSELAATATAEIATAVRTELATELGRIDAATSTRLASASYTAPDNASIAAILTDTAEIGAAGAGLTALASAANLATVAGYLDTEIAAVLAVTNKLDTALELDGAVYRFTANALEEAPTGGGGGPTADEIADALLDRTDGVETGLTPRQAWRLVAAACAGKASGLDTGSPVYRNVGDTKDRITATTDQYGNRSAVTVDAT